MFPLEKDDVKSVRINLSHLEVQGVVRICEKFPHRYTTEITNGYFLVRINEVTYMEFCELVAIYSYFLKVGKFHTIARPVPHVDIHLTSTEERSLK